MKTYTYQPTQDPNLFRVVDRKGDWEHYLHHPSGRHLRAVNAILRDGYAKGFRFYQYLKNHTAEEIDRVLTRAGDRGDAVHQFISMIFNNPVLPNRTTPIVNDDGSLRELTDDEWQCILAFQNFWNAHEPILIDHEKPVFDLKLGYAGTRDARLKLTKACGYKTGNYSCPCKTRVGKVGAFDWKSGGGIYPDYWAQLALYWNPERTDYTSIVRLGTSHKRGFEFVAHSKAEVRRDFQIAKAALKIANKEYQPFDPKKEIYDIPETLSIKLNREPANILPLTAERK